MKKANSSSNGKSEEFERFEQLFRKVASVPKSVVEKAEAKERLKNQKERERKKAAKV